MSHSCPECGLEHGDLVVEAPAEPAAEAAVEIAGIEAARDVKLAQINAGTEEAWRDARIAELQGEMKGMKEMLERLLPEPEPEPEPVPVIVQEPEPDPVVEPTGVQPPPVVEPITTPKKKGNAWWS